MMKGQFPFTKSLYISDSINIINLYQHEKIFLSFGNLDNWYSV